MSAHELSKYKKVVLPLLIISTLVLHGCPSSSDGEPCDSPIPEHCDGTVS